MNQDFKKLEEYFKKAESNKIEFRGNCHDCGESVTVKADVTDDGKLIIDGGAIYFPEFDKCDDFYLKCNSCYKEEPTLKNFRKISVFSRVVGFYTPVEQWNKGKKQEMLKRKEYKIPDNIKEESKAA